MRQTNLFVFTLIVMANVFTVASHAQPGDGCDPQSARCLPWTNVLNGAEYYSPDDPENEIFQPESYSFRFVPPGESSEVWGGSVSFFVEKTGGFTIDASSPAISIRLALYEGNFDPTSPSENLMTGDAGANFETVSAQLTAGIIYYVVVSSLDIDSFSQYSIDVTGDSGVLLNSCYLEPDEIRPSIHVFDDEFGSVDVGGFCAAATWRDFDDRTGSGTVVGHRSKDSVIFSFFDRDNWELNLKILDGCAFNDHYWVFLSASTNVEYGLKVFQTFEADRLYFNPLGTLAPATADIRAIPCPL